MLALDERPLRYYAPASARELAHLPGHMGLPFVGNAVPFLRDARGLTRRSYALYGPVLRTHFLGASTVILLGEDALELVLADRERNFSSEQGWAFSLERLFPRGLMLMDFDEHRFHRRLMQVAFRRSALEAYVERMNAHIARGLPDWASLRGFRFYPAIKALTLHNAAGIFLGLSLGEDAEMLNRAFVDTVAASLAVVRVPVPGLALHRGLQARRRLEAFIRARIPERRDGDGADMFSELCRARTEDDEAFDDQAIVDHLIFLMMAAHDTVTSALTTTAYLLAAHPDEQERLREQSLALDEEQPGYADLDALTRAELVFKEALRLETPVPYIPRRAVRELTFRGHRIPPNTQVSVSPDHTHYDKRLWTDPERFDPGRFADERAEHKRHPFAFVPFGGGAHTCIGMRFATVLAKLVLHQLLRRYRLHLTPGYVLRMQQIPIPRPRDGLPLRLESLR